MGISPGKAEEKPSHKQFEQSSMAPFQVQPARLECPESVFFWICLGCGNEKVLDLCQSMSLGAKNGSQRAFCRAKHIFWLSKCEAKCVTCQTFLCGGNTYSPHCRVNCCGSAFYHNGSIPRKVRGMVMFVHGCVDSSWAYIYTDLI